MTGRSSPCILGYGVAWTLCLAAMVVSSSSRVDPSDPSDAATPRDAERLFVREIRPLLASKCLPCHGGEPQRIKGGLDLRSREGLLRGGDSEEPALVPGRPAESLLFVAVTRENPDLEMPPKENDRLSVEQMDLLRTWIEAGAPWPSLEAESRLEDEWRVAEGSGGVPVETSGGLSDDWTHRRYQPADLWAFQPVKSGAVPAGVRHPIDAFVDRRLSEARLAPAPAADRRTLIRRMSFDLTGLPPDPREVEAFVRDESPGAVDKLIDGLLASPRYGERMAQHWLDVVRYADTAGYANDWERPNAWRYRDYVVRSFQEDKPFDRFVMEQIAGDELDPENPEMRVAVGYLRMGPWEHTGMSVAAVTRQLWLDDVTNAVGEVFLAHPLRCARCHDHKFDPIPTRDYYRVQAVFAGTQFAATDAPLLADECVASSVARDALVELQLAESGLEPLVEIEDDNVFDRIRKKLTAYRELALKRFKPLALSVRNADPEDVSILLGGAIERRGDPVTPGALSAVAVPAGGGIPESGEGRRLALACWVASRDNPLTARVIVNRIWQWHFGRGLVATPSNFGRTGARPSHPDLLDWLAAWFVANDWSVKELHRLILSSEAYRRGTRHPDRGRLAEVDPDDRLLARFSPRRLTAEEIRDAMLAATGELSLEMGGPGIFPEINWEVALQPRHIMGSIAPSYRPSPRPEERNRRTLYAFRYRGLADPMLEVFNRPSADLSCESRDATTVTPQAFELLNGRFGHDRALVLADRLAKERRDVGDQVDRAFRRVLFRSPSADERRAAVEHVERMAEHHRAHPPQPIELPVWAEREMIAEETGVLFRWRERMALDGYVPDLRPWEVAAETRALADLCLVLLNSSELLYVY